MNGKVSAIYIVLILTAALAGFAYTVRMDGIFACQAVNTAERQYVGMCNSPKFGDYDHGAVWFELEDEVVSSAADASVLFLGNSRMQFALSSPEVDGWFQSQGLDYYLLGFSHSETHLFFEPLLAKLDTTAALYILNVDQFFDDRSTGPASSILNDADAYNRYRQKRSWLRVHARVCGAVPALCGDELSFVRWRSNGSWVFQGASLASKLKEPLPEVTFDHGVDEEVLTHYLERARPFIAGLREGGSCVVLMNVPASRTSAGTATAFAEAMGLPLVAPELSGLMTFDGDHLDPPSASRWSAEFVAGLEQAVAGCPRTIAR